MRSSRRLGPAGYQSDLIFRVCTGRAFYIPKSVTAKRRSRRKSAAQNATVGPAAVAVESQSSSVLSAAADPVVDFEQHAVSMGTGSDQTELRADRPQALAALDREKKVERDPRSTVKTAKPLRLRGGTVYDDLMEDDEFAGEQVWDDLPRRDVADSSDEDRIDDDRDYYSEPEPDPAFYVNASERVKTVDPEVLQDQIGEFFFEWSVPNGGATLFVTAPRFRQQVDSSCM